SKRDWSSDVCSSDLVLRWNSTFKHKSLTIRRLTAKHLVFADTLFEATGSKSNPGKLANSISYPPEASLSLSLPQSDFKFVVGFFLCLNFNPLKQIYLYVIANQRQSYISTF